MVHEDAQPYKALAASVIWQGVADAVLAEKNNQKSTAVGWLFDESEDPLTFRWWCDVAEMDPDNILDVVRRQWLNLALAIERGLSIWQGDADAGG